jgi:hypothetical protein
MSAATIEVAKSMATTRDMKYLLTGDFGGC